MNIITRKCWGILIGNILIVGLTACSSDPAPWTRPDESPWSGKHAATESSDEQVVVEEPVLIEEPEPYVEPVMIEEPVAVVAAVAVPEPEPVVMSAEQQIMAMDSGYAVQIYASSTLRRVDQFRSDHGLDEMLAVKTDRAGSTIFVLVSPQPDRESATMVASELQRKTGTKPWVRAIQGLQKVVAE